MRFDRNALAEDGLAKRKDECERDSFAARLVRFVRERQMRSLERFNLFCGAARLERRVESRDASRDAR